MGRKCIVVTEKQGSHRFSYRGKNLEPRAICTDTLSHILLCDHFIHAVHMLNKDGQFLKYLLTKTNGVMRPWSLSYDFIRNQLWVGSKENKISIYKYISEKKTASGNSVMKFFSLEQNSIFWQDFIRFWNVLVSLLLDLYDIASSMVSRQENLCSSMHRNICLLSTL